jgi:hypothetical protein
MEKRETHKDVELSGRRWRIEKFDAMTGSYIAYKLMFEMLPMGMNAKIGNLPSNRKTMSKEDFLSLQRDCLSVCRQLQMVGTIETPIPIMMPNGAWAVADLDTDTMTVMLLTIDALVFNVSGFFDGNALKELADSFQGLTLFNAKT